MIDHVTIFVAWLRCNLRNREEFYNKSHDKIIDVTNQLYFSKRRSVGISVSLNSLPWHEVENI